MRRPTLADNHQPTIPRILRGKKRSTTLHQASLPSTLSPDIRVNLDNNLNQIFNILRQKKALSNSTKQQILDNKQPIRLVNQKLVKQYINIVYKQYNIRDPLSDNTNYGSGQDGSTTQRRNNSKSINQNSTNRKAVHLKQSFLIQMFSPDQNTMSHSPNKYTREQSSIKNMKSTEIDSPNKLNAKRRRQTEMVDQSYRYCFVCQQPILEANVSAHQRNRCPQFSNLYQLSLHQLKQLLLQKIQKIRKTIYHKLQTSNTKNTQKMLGNLFQQAYNYLRTIDINIIGCQQQQPNSFQHANPMQQRGQVRNYFNNVLQSFNIDYFELHAEIRKLQWFVSMYFNLQNQYGKFMKQSGQRSSFNNKPTKVREPDRRFSLAH